MYVVIVGAGRVGKAMATWLLQAEQEVTVIDRDADRCAAIEDDLGSVAVLGDATEYAVLAAAGAVRAQALIATGRSDEENLVICQMAKRLFGVEVTMSTVNVSERRELFYRLGVDVSLDTAAIIVETFQENLGRLLAEDIGGA